MTILPHQDARTRIQFEHQLVLIHTQIDLAQTAPLEALKKLQEVLLTSAGNADDPRSDEWVQATGLLATTYAQLNRWDKATEYWGQLASARPGDVGIVRAAAGAYLAAGDPVRALECLDKCAGLTEPTSDLLVQQVEAHLALQLSRPVADRNWSEFRRTLKAARAKAAERWELVFAGFEYLLASDNNNAGDGANSGNRQRAATLLRSAEAQFAAEALFWRQLSLAYQRLGAAPDVARAMARYAELETSPVERTRLEVSLLVSERKLREADDRLVAILPSLSPSERRELEPLRVRILAAANDLPAAQQLVAKLIEAAPENASLLALGIETCLDGGDFNTAKKWEAALRKHSADGFDWRYLRARRMVASYEGLSSEEKTELRQLVRDLQDERPRWYRLAALAALHALLQGDKHQALADFQKAIDLGDPRPMTLQQLVTLLYEQNRFTEAEELLARLTAKQPGNPLLDALAIDQAIVQDRLADAVEMARQGGAVSRRSHATDLAGHLADARQTQRGGRHIAARSRGSLSQRGARSGRARFRADREWTTGRGAVRPGDLGQGHQDSQGNALLCRRARLRSAGNSGGGACAVRTSGCLPARRCGCPLEVCPVLGRPGSGGGQASVRERTETGCEQWRGTSRIGESVGRDGARGGLVSGHSAAGAAG